MSCVAVDSVASALASATKAPFTISKAQTINAHSRLPESLGDEANKYYFIVDGKTDK
jgi:hypothetical protein